MGALKFQVLRGVLTVPPSGQMLVKFIDNPTGRFNLAYNIGDVVEIENKQAALLIEGLMAVEVEVEQPKSVKTSKKKPVNPETELDAE